MNDVNTPAVTELHQERSRRVSRAMAARRRLDRAPFPARRGERPRAGGRAWVNGVEVGGTDPRHSTLAAAYD
jgi:hypothetical protein